MKWFATSRLFNVPLVVTLSLIAANAILFLSCLHDAGTPTIPVNVLVMKGALTAASAQAGQHWHLIAYGFLHRDATHLGLNLLSLLICGPFLERRLGPSTFVLIYVAALVGGGLASVFAHAMPFATVGSSGGVFGILGALFALWILGAKDLSARFFLINFTTNFVFATRYPDLDYAVHIGGFVTGMASIAILDLLTKMNMYWLRCKFPEFVKLNVVILATCGGLYVYLYPPRTSAHIDTPMFDVAIWLLATLVFIKIMDIFLAIRHGLIGIVFCFAVFNSLSSYISCEIIHRTYKNYCYPGPYKGEWMNEIIHEICIDPTFLTYAVTASVFVLTLMVHIYPLQRGFRDVGFVGATFTAERRRQRVRGAL